MSYETHVHFPVMNAVNCHDGSSIVATSMRKPRSGKLGWMKQRPFDG